MAIGDIVNGRWKIIESKGKGGQGQVYKVSNLANEDVYALKFLNNQKDKERRIRMHNEVSNAKALINPHLVKIIDSNSDLYEDESVKLFYVSTFVDGVTLEEYRENNAITFEECMNFFCEMLNVIAYCHKQGVIHRDIKPDNILIKNNNLLDFILIDFGLSFNFEELQITCTPTNQQLGNRFILLPELVSGTKEQKRKTHSDITQACAVFFYMITGDIPNALLDGEGKSPHQRENSKAKLRSAISDNIIYENINCIFDRCFANNICERYGDVEELLRDIKSINERRVNVLGGDITGMEISSNGGNMPTTLRYSELIRELNPSTEICNPAGLQLPAVTNIEQLVPYGAALPVQIQNKVVKYYGNGDFATAAEQVWTRAINILRKRILSLGEDFVADMVETNDMDYVRDLPAYKVINLAHELGFIDKAGKRKLLNANELFNYFQNTETEEYEEMPQDEANIIIKNGISYILYSTEESFGLQFNDFREKLKTGRITDLFEDENSMFATCPYFYLKTSVRSLLNLFSETEGIEFDNVTNNMNVVIPKIWDRLKLEERRAVADTYTEYHNKNDLVKVQILRNLMLKVHGFDYVMENVRSRTFIAAARRLKDVHFAANNFYNEPSYIKTLEDLGTVIPKLALKDCMTAILFVKLGNKYGTSWNAVEIANRLLARMTDEEWCLYLERYMKDETDLLDYINDCMPMRTNWKKVIKEYGLKDLNLVDPIAKRLVSI